MKEYNVISQSVALLDNVYSNLKLEQNQQITVQVQNPFEQIVSSSLALKGIFSNIIKNFNVIEKQNSNLMHKEFLITNGNNYNIIYDFFPPRIELKCETKMTANQVIPIIQKIIDFASIESKIGQIGINYEIFIKEDSFTIKDLLLKDKISKEFTGLSATPVFQIDENTVLNLTLAGAVNTEDEKGIYIQANFHNIVTNNNTINQIFNKDFLTIAKKKIDIIFDN